MATALSHYIIIPRLNFIAGPKSISCRSYSTWSVEGKKNVKLYVTLLPFSFILFFVLCFHLTLSINTIWCLSLLGTCKTIWLGRIVKNYSIKNRSVQQLTPKYKIYWLDRKATVFTVIWTSEPKDFFGGTAKGVSLNVSVNVYSIQKTSWSF